VPPLKLDSVTPTGRLRSHSFSITSRRASGPVLDSNDFQLLPTTRDTRRKSSVDLTTALLNLQIPHYRLGTPTFTDLGTAYLHNSTHISTPDDLRSSAFSPAELDHLFTPPSGRPSDFIKRNPSSPSLHQSHVARVGTPSPTPPLPVPAPGIDPTLYDSIEADPDNPSIVRYNLATGRIIAATPARLVAQITSPFFLDYELLSDFFLTFRRFLPCRDLLEYLLMRLKWALGIATDARRIVRVRTFVALRHWILNYFSEDFMTDTSFRQRFCDLVNQLARHLRQRTGHDPSEIDIIGELKKCWRRTCAMFWPNPDVMDTSPDTDITPGGQQNVLGNTSSLHSMLLGKQPSKADFRRVSKQIRIPFETEREPEDDRGSIAADGPGNRAIKTVRTANIPATPMSEDSIQVLSCSVPFLGHNKKDPNAKVAARPAGLQSDPSVSQTPRRPHQNKRSSSFSDALRDGRTPLPSRDADNAGVRALQGSNFTGGLVRGLLLPPSPAGIEMLTPLSPGPDAQALSGFLTERDLDSYQTQNQGVKRLVGDVRRALSSRRGPNRSPVRGRLTADSTDPPTPELFVHHVNPSQSSAWQQLRGPPRVDVLGSRIGAMYDYVFQDAKPPGETDRRSLNEQEQSSTHDGIREHTGHTAYHEQPDWARLNSDVTAGTRSIVIVDDTGLPEITRTDDALPPTNSRSNDAVSKALIGQQQGAIQEISDCNIYAAGLLVKQSTFAEGLSARQGHPSNTQTHEALVASDRKATAPVSGEHTHLGRGVYPQPRKSSGIHPTGLDMHPVRNQLRRRPGGDLKAADHVHELEPLPRPQTAGSFSTPSRSQETSAAQSVDLSGTHFSGQGLALWSNQSRRALEDKKDSMALLETHSSQPNLSPSFQAQISKLAELPNHSYDGRVEDTLLRLEGRKSSLSTTVKAQEPGVDETNLTTTGEPSHGSLEMMDASIPVPGLETTESWLWSPTTEIQGASIYRSSDASSDLVLQRHSPILRFDAGGVPKSLDASSESWAQHRHPDQVVNRSVVFASHSSAVEDNVTGVRSSQSKSASRSQGSFLLNDNESLSDISTEIADEPEDSVVGISFFFDDTVDEAEYRRHPSKAPPTPPSTADAPLSQSSERSMLAHNEPLEPKALSEEVTSAPKLLAQRPLRPDSPRSAQNAAAPPSEAHMPFILAFESEVIAEQLTIIEKDALDEIDWNDLVALNWHKSPANIRNWVDYLMRDDYNGVDIVIARFNLVVKWVVSECILTEATSERARCITKFIHIASHCHHLRNYASMYQITLALLSSDLARLHRTWAFVAPAEKQTLERLEKLCQPLHNFSGLRAEMESASLENGCIPFIGLYTHDLAVNAQKPARVDAIAPAKEPLVNFERFQAAAVIVKGLLRLIEASSMYALHAHREVLSRCLWLAALEDEEIVARSLALEQ